MRGIDVIQNIDIVSIFPIERTYTEPTKDNIKDKNVLSFY